MFWCSVCTPFCSSLWSCILTTFGDDFVSAEPSSGASEAIGFPIIPTGLLHHPFSTSSGSFPTLVGPIRFSETSGNPQVWKDSSQVSVIESQVEKAGRGGPWDPAGHSSPGNPGCRTSPPPGRDRGPQYRDTQRGPFPALQLATLLSERQSVSLSPAHAGRMKEN